MVYEFGARLLQLRKAKNLTQQALVDRAKALDPDLHLSDSALANMKAIILCHGWQKPRRLPKCWAFHWTF
ncbi:hypothetical protein [uncultured Subdoligranulum sp.]|uniref:hypothetical protein n=1 Tax=uncultured Subdoligranulum sp. TaxID=512298 RepID=UPI0025E201D5|nr:hypothetical protein [uncultured Subdoligranulum sp.]